MNRWRLWAAMAAVMIFGIAISAGCGGTETAATLPYTPPPSIVASTTTVTYIKPLAELTTTTSRLTTTTLPATTTTTVAPEWTQVAKYSGSSRKVTTAFALSGGEARLTYSVSGSRPYLSCFVVPDGQEVDRPGSELAVETKNPGSDATRLMMDSGRYYLYVIAYGCEWTIQIEELQ